MDRWLLSFFLGAILSLFLPIVPDLFTLFIFILLAFVFLAYPPLKQASGLFFGCAWLLFSGYQYQQAWQDNNLDPVALAQRSHVIEAEVITLPSYANKTHRFNVRVFKLNAKTLTQAINIRLSWKNAHFTIAQGQQLQLNVKFKPAHGLANPGGFNYQNWLRQKHLVATGYVKKDKKNKVLVENISFRQQLYHRYANLLPKHHLSPLLLALSFAERSTITPELWQILQKTGTQHLIAISGLHLGLVATGSFTFFLLLLRFAPLAYLFNLFKLSPVNKSKILTFNTRYLAILLSLGLSIAYAYLADFSLPTMRALVMLNLYWLARFLGLYFSLKRWLLLTVFVVLVLSPLSITSASFWLSFYAVCLILLTLWRFSSLLEGGNKPYRFLKSLFIIQLSLTVFLLPVAALFYQQVSLAAIFANIIAVPLMSFITIVLCLLSVITLLFSDVVASFFMQGALASLEWVWWWLSLVAKQPFALVELSSGQVMVISTLVFMLFLKVFLLTKNRNTNNMMILSLLLIALLWRYVNHESVVETALWRIHVLDVGQGLAIVIEKNNHAILYDTGAAFPSGFNMVEAVVLPFLQHKGIKELDKVIISHKDNDHSGGLQVLLKNKQVNELVANHLYSTKSMANEYIPNKKTSNKSLSDQALIIKTCLQGQSFIWQNLTFEQLWPQIIQGKNNDDSCVIRISDGKHSVLLTGDISKKVEKTLIYQAKDKKNALKSELLIVPHHGSKTSSSFAFIKAVDPDVAIFSAGFLNRWHMPVTEVTARYEQEKITRYNTATSGMITVDFTKKMPMKVTQYKQNTWPYWFAN